MKYILLLLLLLTTPFCYAQIGADSALVCDDPFDAQVCQGICNVRFGMSFEETRNILEKKFGEEFAYAENYMLGFKDQIYAGVFFNKIIFTFQNDGIDTFLYKCLFSIDAKNAEDAKRKRDFLYNALEDKYYMIERIGEDKFKYYLGGTSPLDNESYAFEIAVFKNDKNEWSAYLLYGPFDYINEEF